MLIGSYAHRIIGSYNRKHTWDHNYENSILENDNAIFTLLTTTSTVLLDILKNNCK